MVAPLKQAIHLAEGDEARDTYPSGHVTVAVVTIWFTLRHRLWLALISVPQALAVIFSTLYLRYHYVTDVVAGLVLGVLVIFLGWWIDRAVRRRRTEGREVVYQSRHNTGRAMGFRIAMGLLVGAPATYGGVVAWKLWRGIAWPDPSRFHTRRNGRRRCRPARRPYRRRLCRCPPP